MILKTLIVGAFLCFPTCVWADATNTQKIFYYFTVQDDITSFEDTEENPQEKPEDGCTLSPQKCQVSWQYFKEEDCSCQSCPADMTPNEAGTGCRCINEKLTINESGTACYCATEGESCGEGTNQIYDATCSCICQDGYELYNNQCLPICNEPGMSGERDVNGNCICTEDICLCPKGYMVNPDKTCVYCPTQTAGGETCSTLCTFAPTDPVGCCKMVVVDGRENCLEEGRSDFSSVQLVLGNMKGKYRITYISGAVTNSRFAPNPTWFVNADDALEHRFWISDPYNRNQMPGIVASYPSIEVAEAANKGASIITQNYRGDVHVAIYRRDGDQWYWYNTSGPGCSDNCGQIKYLFEKISD